MVQKYAILIHRQNRVVLDCIVMKRKGLGKEIKKVKYNKILKRFTVASLALSMFASNVFAFVVTPKDHHAFQGEVVEFAAARTTEEEESMTENDVEWYVDGERIGTGWGITVDTSKYNIGDQVNVRAVANWTSVSGNSVSGNGLLTAEDQATMYVDDPAGNPYPGIDITSLVVFSNDTVLTDNLNPNRDITVRLVPRTMSDEEIKAALASNPSLQFTGSQIYVVEIKLVRNFEPEKEVNMVQGSAQVLIGAKSAVNIDVNEKVIAAHIVGNTAEHVGTSEPGTDAIIIETRSFSPFVFGVGYIGESSSTEESGSGSSGSSSSSTVVDSSVPSTLSAGTVTLAGGGSLIALGADDLTFMNTTIASMFYVANTFPGYLANVLAINTFAPPLGYVDGTPVTINWKVDGVNSGDVIFAVHYNENTGEMEYIPCVAGQGVVSFEVTSFGNIGLVRVLAPSDVATSIILNTVVQR